LSLISLAFLLIYLLSSSYPLTLLTAMSIYGGMTRLANDRVSFLEDVEVHINYEVFGRKCVTDLHEERHAYVPRLYSLQRLLSYPLHVPVGGLFRRARYRWDQKFVCLMYWHHPCDGNVL
jgi:hypothetical protein